MDLLPTPRLFQTTQWTMVRQAAGTDDALARKALAALCNSYWYPLYAYIRRTGASPHDAEDLTQGFFAHLIEKGILADADPSKGKLRTFLLACTRHYLADERDRAMAQKRGAAVLVHFDSDEAEKRYVLEPIDHLSPDRLYQRQWALAVLSRSLEQLGEEYRAAGKEEVFAELRPFLGFGQESKKQYDKVAKVLGMAVGTVKSLVFRMRERWREILFDQVGATLDDPTPEDIRAELTELMGCV